MNKITFTIICLAVLLGMGKCIVEEPEFLATTKGTASFTYYNSYAKCCPKNPNYDPKADKSECEDYSAC
jgi:hypothetical protein